MKIKTFLVRSFTVAAGLCAASNLVNAAPKATFTDSWKDTAVSNTTTGDWDATDTGGKFSFSISLPGIVGANFNSNTVVLLAIGTNYAVGGPQTILTNALMDDTNYTAGKKTATFPILLADGTSSGGNATVSWNTTNITVTGSASADVLGGQQLFTNTFTSNYAVGELMLVVDTTLNADGSINTGGTVNTNDFEVPLIEKNTATLAKNTNSDGSYTALQAGSITGTVDFTLPTVTITSPAANTKFQADSPVVSLAGKASDKYGLASIQCFVTPASTLVTSAAIDIDQLSSLPTATNSSFSWTASVNLTNGAPGTNTITVVVKNTLGDTKSVSRNFLLVVTNRAIVWVTPAGAGTITGIKSNQVVQVEENYTVTAKAANAYWIFSEWTNSVGAVLSTSSSFAYSGESSPTLVACFVPNPFYDTGLAGTYVGLFTDTNNPVDPTNSGYITLTVTPAGGYSGKLNLGQSASSFALSGQLTVSGPYASGSSIVKISKTESLAVALNISIDPDLMDQSLGSLSGTVTDGTIWSGIIQGQLAQVDPDVVPGVYNVVISPTNDPAGGPGGFSYGTATVKNGAVTMVLNLADGTSPATSFTTFMTAYGGCPVYASLYGGKGILFGSLMFASDGSRTVTNWDNLSWVKYPLNDKFYTNGFNYTPTVFGSLFESLAIFDWTTNGVFDVDQGYSGLSLADDTGGIDVTFNPAKKTLSDTNKVTITLNASTGALSGSFKAATFDLQPNAVATPTFRGVVTGDAGWGFYSSTNQETGPVTIQGPSSGD